MNRIKNIFCAVILSAFTVSCVNLDYTEVTTADELTVNAESITAQNIFLIRFISVFSLSVKTLQKLLS